MDTMLLMEMELKDSTVRLCEGCSEAVVEELIRELSRLNRLNSGV